MKLDGKVALITGGARMGLAMGRALAQKGVQVLLTWRHSKASAEEFADQIRTEGGQAWAVRCDLSKSTSVQTLIRFLTRRWGQLDILLNMASIYETSSIGQKESVRHWHDHWSVHVQDSYGLSKAVLPLMKKAPTGRMIFFSDWTSASGRPRYPDLTAYYTSKMGVKGLTESLALELAPHILVNAVAPGPILPPAHMSAAERKAVEKATPLRRWGGPEEIAKAVLFLVETDFITGETIRVDGGRHLY